MCTDFALILPIWARAEISITYCNMAYGHMRSQIIFSNFSGLAIIGKVWPLRGGKKILLSEVLTGQTFKFHSTYILVVPKNF